MNAKRGSLFLTILLLTGLTSAVAEERSFVGYISYQAKPVILKTTVGHQGLKYLNEFYRLMGNKAFNFLHRKSADQWMGLTRTADALILHIHDAPAAFNFRAVVDPEDGHLTVLKGVDYKGFSRLDDADYTAHQAVNYLTRVMNNQDIFAAKGGAMTVVKPASAPAAPATKPTPVSKPLAVTPTEPKTTAKTEAPLKPAAEPAKPAAPAETSMKSESPWSKLISGNNRFIAGLALHPNQTAARIAETAKGQKPFAIVVSCSDSRVPPEVLFDQGLGDIFIVRTAGEVVTAVELGSIEYAVEHLGTPYLLVLGHEKCGAVDATVKGGELPPNLAAIAAQIKPAVERATAMGGDLLDNSVRENVKEVLANIKASPILRAALDKGDLTMAGAYYSLDSGKVSQVE